MEASSAWLRIVDSSSWPLVYLAWMAALRSNVSVRRRVKYKEDASHTARITRKPASSTALIVRGGRTSLPGVNGRVINRILRLPNRRFLLSGLATTKIQPPQDTAFPGGFLEWSRQLG